MEAKHCATPRIDDDAVGKTVIAHPTYGDDRQTQYTVTVIGLSEDRKMVKIVIGKEDPKWEKVDRWVIDSVI
jgi:hypothetical protein